MPDHPAPGQSVHSAPHPASMKGFPHVTKDVPACDDKLPIFDEKLTVPWWWWPPGIGLAGLLAAEVHLGYPGPRAWLPYLITVLVAITVLIRMGRHRVRVSGAELRVGPAHIALHHLGQVRVIPRAGKRRALGPDLDPAAFVLHRAWIGPLVRVELTDPRDSTPYWIFSVRRATDLAAVLDPGTGPAEADEPRQDGPEGHFPAW